MRSSILARKVVWRVVVAGFMASILLSAIQLSIRYNEKLSEVKQTVERVGDIFMPSLAKSVWSYDLPQVELQMRAIMQQPYIDHSEIDFLDRTPDQLYGKRAATGDGVSQEIVLLYPNPQVEMVPVGTLILESDLANLRDGLVVEGLQSFLFNSLVILLIGGAILMVVQNLVTRRITAMASLWGRITEADLRTGSFEGLIQKQKTKVNKRSDELEQLENVIQIFFSTAMRALHEAKQKEKVLTELTKKADAANTAKTEFLSNMSHEIRTPMNGITGIADILLSSNIKQSERNLVLQLQKSAANLLQIINDILDFSKIEAHELKIVPRVFDPIELVEEVSRSLSPLAQAKKIEFICPSSVDPEVIVKADKTRVRQVLINLVGNALKFTDQGEVLVEVSACVSGDKNCELSFRVIDTGIGIPEDQRSRIFERFSQADGTATRSHGGTGLGLAISKKLIELMGGEIGFSPRVNGSEFWFSIPAEFESYKESLPEIDAKKIALLGCNAQLDRYVRDCLSDQSKLSFTTVSSDQFSAKLASGELLQLIQESDQIWFEQKLGQAAIEKFEAELKGSTQPGSQVCFLLTDNPLFRVDGSSPFAASVSKPISPAAIHQLVATGTVESNIPIEAPQANRKVDSFPGLKVLLVEDNEVNRMVAIGLLRRLKVEVTSAENGAEALVCMQKQNFDLVFMDIQMPIMDGYEATKRVRAGEQGVSSSTIIVALTANAFENDRTKCLAAGMNDFIAKPISMKVLVGVLNRWFKSASITPLLPEAEPIESEEKPSLVFDERAFSELLMQDEELIKQVIEIFLLDIPKGLSELETMQSKNDLDGVRRIAHRLKGAAGNVSGAKMQSLAYDLEVAGQAQDSNAVEKILPLLESAFFELKEELQNYAKGLSE